MEEALFVARLGRQVSQTNWVKLEVIPDASYLLPDPIGTLEAAKLLVKDGFIVLPYIHADPVLAKHLEDAGCATVMPLGSAIGSGQGIHTAEEIRIIIEQARVPVVVDAGLGVPSDASQALEMGASGCSGEHRHSSGRGPQPHGPSVPQGSGSRAGGLCGRTHPAAGLQPLPAAPPSTFLNRRLLTRAMGVLPTPTLCLVTDRAARREAALEAAVVAAVGGGVDMVQLRKKDLPGRALLAVGQRLKQAIDGRAFAHRQ